MVEIIFKKVFGIMGSKFLEASANIFPQEPGYVTMCKRVKEGS